VTRHIVIGAGVAGHQHIRVLAETGRELAAVLDLAQDRFAHALREALEREPDNTIWHICTPTDTHLAYLRLLLGQRPQAPIILEKPIGRKGDLSEFAALTNGRPVVVQSQYNHAVVIALLASQVSGSEAAPLAIELDFAKRRHSGGRFVDRDRRAIGYEGFHHFAIVLRIVEAARGDAGRCAFAQHAQVLRASNDACGYELVLEHDGVRARLGSRLDEDGRSSRIAVAHGSDAPTLLSIENDLWYTGAVRQTHLLAGPKIEAIFEEDLMQTGLNACIAALSTGDRRAVRQNQRRAVEIEQLLDRAQTASFTDATTSATPCARRVA
jgi:predicted dehydrogenase